jgi:cyclase
MIRKRLVGVVTVRDGWAVQSISYARHLPLGRPEVLVENLDRWGADEILLQCIDRREAGPDLALLERVSRTGISTPLIYAGGIRSADDAVSAVKAGADRVCVDALMHDDPRAAAALSEPLGAQAVIAALPVSHAGGRLQWLDHRSRSSKALAGPPLEVLKGGAISEALLIDWRHEGVAGAFDMQLLDLVALGDVPLIAFGGLSEPALLERALKHPNVSAVAVGNFLNYQEHAIGRLKRQLVSTALRPADAGMKVQA